MEDAPSCPPSRPASVVHDPPHRTHSSRSTRAAQRSALRNASRAPTPSVAASNHTTPYDEDHCESIAHSLDTLPPPFALNFLPGIDEIRNFSSGEMVIIPLLCSVAAALTNLSARPNASTNLAPLETSIANLSARLAPRPVTSFAEVTARPPPRPSSPPLTVQDPSAKKKGKKTLKKKSASPSSPADVAAASDLPPPAKTTTFPTAARRFFAPRTEPLPHQAAQNIIRSFPDVAANALRDANCPFPLSFSAMCNRKGSVTLLSHSPTTPASAYSPYFDLLTSRLNQAYPVGDNPFLQFRLAPCEAQLVIHSVPNDVLPLSKEDLFQVMSIAIRNTCEVNILDSRFLQPDPELRQRGTATSVVIILSPDDVPTIGSRIRIFSKSCSVRPAHSSSRYSQCRKCLRFGHVQAACKALHFTCPLCALHHPHSEHRCANLGCPKQGNLRPVPNCCVASALRCACCGSDHAAFDRMCPARPRQPEQSADDYMDTSAPQDESAPPPNPPQHTQETPRPTTPPQRPPLPLPTMAPPPTAAPQSFSSQNLGFNRRHQANDHFPSRFGGSFHRPFDEEELKHSLFNPVPQYPPRPPPSADD